MTQVLHTAWISNDDRVLYNDTETIIVRVNILLFTIFICDTSPTYCRISNDESHCMYNDVKTLIKTLLRLLTVLSMLFLQTSSQPQVPNITLLPQLHLTYSKDGIQRASWKQWPCFEIENIGNIVVEQQKLLTSKYNYRAEVKKSSVNGRNHLIVIKLLLSSTLLGGVEVRKSLTKKG